MPEQRTTLHENVLTELPRGLSLPIVGDTFAFIEDPGAFLAKKTRDLGPVFRIDVFGAPTACFVGPEAFEIFLDPRFVVREKANPPHVEELFDARAVPFLDGDVHRRRKGLLLRAFTPDALTSYLPILERVIRRYSRRWAELGRFPWVPELSQMGFTIAAALFTGADPDADDPEIERAFDEVAAGLLSAPIRLPFTAFGRALRARERLMRVVDAAVDARLDGERRDDLLQRLVDARVDGEKLSRDELRVETFHFFGAYAAVIGGLSFLAQHLGEHPDVADRVRAEIAQECGGAITLADLSRMRLLDGVCKEARRTTSIIPMTFFGRVAKDCSFRGLRIPKGMKAVGCLDATMHDPQIFADPERFSPERWARASRRQEAAWVPHGGGEHATGHRCAGEKLANLMLQVFAVHMLRGFAWSLTPGQDLTPTRGKLFATPAGGLDVRFTRRS